MDDDIFVILVVWTLTDDPEREDANPSTNHENPTARTLHGEDSDFDTVEDLPATKRQLSGDFALQTNTLSLGNFLSAIEID